MLKSLAFVLNGIAEFLRKLAFKVYRPKPLKLSIHQIRAIPWIKVDGDHTHRLNYDLDENSVVLDFGGYEGQWASEIYCKYGSFVYIFEPYLPFAQKIIERFITNSRITVFSFGLSNSDRIENLSISANESSMFKSGDSDVEIQLKDAFVFLSQANFNKIDLVKINIEGGEYDLLERLIESGIVGRMSNLQIQFHDFVPNAEQRMKDIQRKLSLTHILTYRYEFIWENWKLRD